MSFVGILRKLFQNAGAGPLLRADILPLATPETPGAAPALGAPGQVLQVSADRRPVWGNGSGVPPGCILLWYGKSTNIPLGWALCDGKNGTPDLRDRFVIGASEALKAGTTGGAASASPAVTVGATTLTTAQMPSHTHDGVLKQGGYLNAIYPGDDWATGWGNSGATGGGGSHTHPASAGSISLLPPYHALCYIMKE